MLVLQRKKNQSIIINDNIEVSVLEIGTDWVKLAFNAPKDVSILRKELIEAAKVNREAAKADSGALDAVKKMMKKEEK
ncbi:MAG: carbon storage regulator CsrA [Lachnospiraceae bacterium]|jgi:carbon storage regulator|nr:carbon storage regulator CsrA [Lachnospiraceae bacterium]